ncbi:MAG: hypothetical protein ACHQUC_04405, partial [Chlamydiales bacterium]
MGTSTTFQVYHNPCEGVIPPLRLYSQCLQEKAIELVENNKWIAGRAIGIIKPIPLIADIVKYLFLALGHIFGSVLVKCKLSATLFNQPCSLSNGFQYLDLALLLTFDLFRSPVANLVNPLNYKDTQTTQFHTQINRLEDEKSALQKQIEDIRKQNIADVQSKGAAHAAAATQHLEQINRLEEGKSALQRQIESIRKQNIADVQSNEAAHKAATTQHLAQINRLEEEKAALQKQIEDIRKQNIADVQSKGAAHAAAATQHLEQI